MLRSAAGLIAGFAGATDCSGFISGTTLALETGRGFRTGLVTRALVAVVPVEWGFRDMDIDPMLRRTISHFAS